MYIQVVNFNLKGMSHDEFTALCDRLAPVFANIPGLLSKVWLADAATNTYGGVYTWQNPQALQDYTRTQIFQNVINHPNFSNITAQGFDILEGPTQVTHGLQQMAIE